MISYFCSQRELLEKKKPLPTCILHFSFISLRLDRLEALLKSGGKEGRETLNGYGEGGEEGDLVDRLAAEVNHLNFLVSHCEGSALLDVCKPVCSLIFVLDVGIQECPRSL